MPGIQYLSVTILMPEIQQRAQQGPNPPGAFMFVVESGTKCKSNIISESHKCLLRKLKSNGGDQSCPVEITHATYVILRNPNQMLKN